jgi:hypothetical protein
MRWLLLNLCVDADPEADPSPPPPHRPAPHPPRVPPPPRHAPAHAPPPSRALSSVGGLRQPHNLKVFFLPCMLHLLLPPKHSSS